MEDTHVSLVSSSSQIQPGSCGQFLDRAQTFGLLVVPWESSFHFQEKEPVIADELFSAKVSIRV